jgi:LPXTG-motif cell wall-anchored protein
LEEIEAMQKSIKIALGTAVSAALLLASTPAFAAPRSLPAGEALYAFGCDDGTEPAVGLVDVATGAVTEVVPGFDDQCFSSPAYNPVDGKIYVIDWSQVNFSSMNTYQLGVFDPEAETLTVVDEFTAGCEPYGLAIDASGNAWVYDSNGENFKPVSLENAACGTGVGSPGAHFYAFAFAPNGTLYGLNNNTGYFGTISTSTGAFTPFGSVPPFTNGAGGLTFDSSGTAWVLNWDNNAEIYSADINDYAGTAELSGQLTFNGTDYFSEAIAVLQAPAAPELPDTGSESVALGVTGLAAAGVIALGAVMMIVRRRAS